MLFIILWYLFIIAAAQHHKRVSVSSTPIGPVAGGMMGCFLVLALAIYWYKHHVHSSNGPHYVSTIQVADGDIPLPTLDHDTDHDPDISDEPTSGKFSVDALSIKLILYLSRKISTWTFTD